MIVEMAVAPPKEIVPAVVRFCGHVKVAVAANCATPPALCGQYRYPDPFTNASPIVPANGTGDTSVSVSVTGCKSGTLLPFASGLVSGLPAASKSVNSMGNAIVMPGSMANVVRCETVFDKLAASETEKNVAPIVIVHEPVHGCAGATPL